MALPIHMFAIAGSKKRHRDNYAAQDAHPRSLEEVLSAETERISGKIIKVTEEAIDSDVPNEASAGLYYYFISLFVTDKENKVHKLIQPMADSYRKNASKAYQGKNVDLNYRKLISGKISSLQLVSNFIWPLWKSQKESKVYPRRENIKAEGIITGGIDISVLEPY